MSETRSRRPVRREVFLNGGLFLFGILLLPVAVYLVGQLVFGRYEGDGFGEFFASLLGRLLGGDFAAWFLVLSPLLIVLVLRGIAWGWRASARVPDGGA